MNLVYSVGETRSKIRDIQMNARNGIMSELVNKASHESIYMVSAKMLNSIMESLPNENIIEYDKDLKIYTMYNKIVPHFYGEGKTKAMAAESMVSGAIAFSNEYLENFEMLSGIFNGIQQFLISTVILNINDKRKIKEILRIV